MAFLKVVSGPQVGKEFRLLGDSSTIGRHPACEIVIDVGAVSRKHARVFRQGLEFWIEDLKSRNHTFINDARVDRPSKLKRGDRVKICDVELVYDDGSEPESGSRIVRPKSDRPQPDSDSSSVMIEDAGASGNTTIMSKVEVSSNHQRAHLSATPQAKLRALMEISQALSKVLSMDEVLPKVLDSLFRIFAQADRGFIVLEQNGDLVPRWSKARAADNTPMRISREIIRHVMSKRQAVLSADATSDARFDVSNSVANLKIRSFMCAPLIDAEGNAMGVIQLDTFDQGGRFQDDDLEVIATVALQAGIAIHNARLHDLKVVQIEMESEMELAREVQHSFLPTVSPHLPGFAFFDSYEPANHVGGDFYDYVPLPDGKLAVVVADVVGHGIAAALLMAKISAETRFSLATESNVEAAVNRLNRSLLSLNVDRFVTMVVGMIDPTERTVTVVNAGHMPPLRRSVDGSVEFIGRASSGLPLGVLEETVYRQTKAELTAGDQLVFMTDGIFECTNAQEEQLGIDRVRQILATEGRGDATRTGKAILTAVQKHRGAGPPDDDMCLVCISCDGK